MSKLIALLSGSEELTKVLKHDYSSSIKQQALLFNQIGVFGLDKIFTSLDKPAISKLYNATPNNLMELRWLMENGIIFEPVIPSKKIEETLEALDKNYSTDYSKTNNKLNKIFKRWNSKVASNKEEIWQFINQELTEINNLSLKKDSILLRLISVEMNKTENSTAILVNDHYSYINSLSNLRKRNVIQITINNLPLPDSTTPWEQIMDFRNDPENQNSLLNLRRWINKISNEDITPTEAQEEIEWLINEFQTHLRFHKIKANSEILEVLIKTPLEIIENVIKLRFSKIIEPVFALKKRQINLMDAELNAPGREMAYIIKAKDTFQSS